MHFRSCRAFAVSMAVLCLPAAAPALAQHCPCMHFSVNGGAPGGAAFPRKILLLPLDVSVYSVGAGGVTERAEELELSERTAIDADLHNDFAKAKKLQFVALPALDAENYARLDEHVALFEQVARAALRHAQGSAAWPQKVSHFDYAVGDGLRFLKQATGADAAMIIGGRADIPTASSHVLGALAILGGVVIIPRARAVAVAGVIDLDTGNVLWLNQSVENTGLASAARHALDGYPDPGAPAAVK
jgi:hypothetical protein